MRLLGLLFTALIIAGLALFVYQRLFGLQSASQNGFDTSLPAVTSAVGNMQDKIQNYDQKMLEYQDSINNN